jgi:hypothetical protein
VIGKSDRPRCFFYKRKQLPFSDSIFFAVDRRATACLSLKSSSTPSAIHLFAFSSRILAAAGRKIIQHNQFNNVTRLAESAMLIPPMWRSPALFSPDCRTAHGRTLIWVAIDRDRQS